MRTIQSFDPSAAASGQIVTQTVNPCSVVVLFNHSLNGLKLELPGGDTANLPPWYFRYYYLPLPGNIQWTKSFQLATSGTPVSLVTGEVYEPSEASQRTFTEGPLPLSMNIGNTVNTSGTGSANTLQNDNNTLATIIEATLSGSPGSNIIVKNDGTIQALQWLSSVLTQIFLSRPHATIPLQLGAAGFIAEILGALQVDQAATIAGTLGLGNSSLVTGKSSDATQGNIFGVDGSGNTFIQHHPKNNQTVIYDKNGNSLVTIDATGNSIYNNAKSLEWKDSGGTARNVLGVDASNNTNLQGITSKDVIQFLKSDGTLQSSFDANLMQNCVGVQQTIAGGTSGVMATNEFHYGIYKVVVVQHNNYNNSGGSKSLSLKTGFNFGAGWLNMGCGPLFVNQNGGASLSANQITWGTGSSAGSSAGGATLQAFAAGVITAVFNRILDANIAGAHTGVAIFIGI